MNVVFDTNIILSSTLWKESAARKLLRQLVDKQINIISSPEIISEYQEVLKRDFDYTDEEVTKIMKQVFEFVTLIKPVNKIDAVKEDPDDNIILECAVESKAEYIITYDKHLLKLITYENIKIIKPEEMMKLI